MELIVIKKIKQIHLTSSSQTENYLKTHLSNQKQIHNSVVFEI